MNYLRYYNQTGNAIDRNDNIAVKMNRKLFEYGNRATADNEV